MLGTIIAIWLLLFIIPKVPTVQSFIGQKVSTALAEKLGTKVIIGNIDIRLPNRITIDDVLIYDQAHKEMLRAGRIAAGIDIMPILDGKIRISSAQLFATHVTLYKRNANSPLNCQFVIDSLKSKDTTSHTPLDLAIGSLIIRHSSVKYDQWDKPLQPHSTFNFQHSTFKDISSNITLRYLTDDAIDIQLKHLAFNEASGLIVSNINGNIKATKQSLSLKELNILLPNSRLTVNAQISPLNKEQGSGIIDITGTVTPKDLALSYQLSAFSKPLYLDLRAKGSLQNLNINLLASLSDGSMEIKARAHAFDILDNPNGTLTISKANISQSLLRYVVAQASRVRNIKSLSSLPKQLSNLGNIRVSGTAHMFSKSSYSGKAELSLSKVGNIKIDANYHGKQLFANIATRGFALGTITGEKSLGNIACNIAFNIANISRIKDNISAKGHISELTYNNYTFHDISLDAALHGNTISGTLDLNDPNGTLHVNGSGNTVSKAIEFADIDIKDFMPLRMNLTNAFGDTPVTAHATIDSHKVQFTSDFIDIDMQGNIDIPSLPRTFANFINRDPRHKSKNDFTFNASIKDINILKRVLNSDDMSAPEGITLNGFFNDNSRTANLNINVPDISFGGKHMILALSLAENGDTLSMPHSTIQFEDDIMTLHARNISYSSGALAVDNLLMGNNNQQMYVNGVLSRNPNDSIVVDMKNIDIRYILDLVNFHSVEFDGKASGHFAGHNLLGSLQANGYIDVADFKFENGHLGDMHIDARYNNINKHIELSALADDKEAYGQTIINGFIDTSSPGGLDLDIKAQDTRLEFMQSFCSTFMKDVNVKGNGRVRLFGPFSNINLEGQLMTDGAFTLSSTNCRYTLPDDTVTFFPDDITFHHFILHDKLGNTATLDGGIHHKHLTRMSYDINAHTPKFLAYDFPTLQDQETFCGHAIIKGDIGVHGKGNELTISANATPLEGTFLTYNAASPDAVRGGEIITWRSANDKPVETLDTAKNTNPSETNTEVLDNGNERTNIHMDFQVHANPDARLHLVMDPTTGDNINLYGNGDLRVEYYNKGGLNIFGNYEVDNGSYKMTIQSLLRRDFSFRKGGTITFGGDPYDAIVNMSAVYAINSVPLADLNIGSNFASNNVPVNCLMNITGTPGKPKVAFAVELPTLSTDARQMVNSVINSEEEMNQQVLYLLAIGRFYAPSNTAQYASSSSKTTTNEVSQSTLAIQSFLSGTLSQSFNNMMSSVMGGLMGSNNSLSFGANVAPGNEGFNNAEYEGLLSGRFFNNRLLFNGQFGYRDRVATNTSSFIGDFSLQYILTKNGLISLKVYNQANDRYFTKNALNTQGIGIVIQKEWGK